MHSPEWRWGMSGAESLGWLEDLEGDEPEARVEARS